MMFEIIKNKSYLDLYCPNRIYSFIIAVQFTYTLKHKGLDTVFKKRS